MKKYLLLLLLVTSGFAQRQWVTGYYPNYSNYPRPAQLNYKVWTHIVHFCVYPDIAFNPDPTHPEQQHWTFDNGRSAFEDATGNQNYPVQRQLIDTSHAHGAKVLLGYFSRMGSGNKSMMQLWYQSPDTLKRFISSTLAYAKSRGYDGVDIDWEWASNTDEGNCWNFLVKTLRDTLDTWTPKGTLTAAMFQWVSRLSPNMDWNLNNKALDQINIMCYDMEYAKRNVAHAPLFPTDCNMFPPGIGYGTKGDNVAELINQYVLKGAKKSKLGMGLPFYGYQHNGSANYCDSSGGGSQIQYYSIQPLYTGALFSRYTFDNATKTPYIRWSDASGNHFLSFDDSLSLAAKVGFGKSDSIGGYMVWEMSQDKYVSNKGQLTGALEKALGSSVIVVPPPIDTVHPPPVFTCLSDTCYNKGRIAGYADGYVDGRASVVCPVCPVCPICPPALNADSIAKFWWNAALDAIADSIKTPEYLKVVKPSKK